jgi:hypothetical protein
MAISEDLSRAPDDELRAIATSRRYGSKTRAAARAALSARGLQVPDELRDDPEPERPRPGARPEPMARGRSVPLVVASCVALAVGAAVFTWRREHSTLELSPVVAIEQRREAMRRGLPQVPLAPPGTSADNVQLFQACGGADIGACTKLGARYTGGIEGTPVDLALGVSLFERGCAGGNGLACAELAVAYGRGRGVAPDPALSRSYAEIACGLGVQQACSAGLPAPTPLPALGR